MTNFKMLTAHGTDADCWHDAWQRLPDELRDIMFAPAYARVQEASGHGPSHCALYSWEKHFVLQPFVLREAGGGKFDIASFYGGGGPVTNLQGWSRHALWEWFERDFSKWRYQHDVICEYAQLHPVTCQCAIDMLGADAVSAQKESVVIKLGSDDEILLEFSDTRLATLSRGQRSGMTAECVGLVGNIWTAFYRMYLEAMKRKGADERWLLPMVYFTEHIVELDPRAKLMAVSKDGNIITMALIVIGGDYASFHFAASIEKPPQGASDLIIYEIAKTAREAGCKYLNLGGGVTAKPDDSLLWFKAGFSKQRRSVHVVKRIFDQKSYDELCTAAKVAENETFFPRYRAAA